MPLPTDTGPPHFCKGCSTCVDGIAFSTLMHPRINFWLCGKCWDQMSPHQRADLRLRLMEMDLRSEEIAKMDDAAELLRDTLGRRAELEEELKDDDWWKRGTGEQG